MCSIVPQHEPKLFGQFFGGFCCSSVGISRLRKVFVGLYFAEGQSQQRRLLQCGRTSERDTIVVVAVVCLKPLQTNYPEELTHLFFLSQLRDEGFFHDELSFFPQRARTRQRAREILRQIISSHTKELLVLECVKDLDDAFVLTDELQEAGIPLMQTLYLESSRVADVFCHKAGISPLQRSKRDKERNVAHREQIWNRDFAKLIEYFSSYETLVDVFAADSAESQGQTFSGRIRAPLTRQLYGDKKKQPLITAKIALPSELRYVLLVPVISSCLVKSKQEVGSVLSDAARSSGLLFFQSQSQSHVHLPSPHKAIKDETECEFLSVPGRYKVSRKGDGTRYMLIIAQDGKTYYRTLSGSLYAYPSVSTRITIDSGAAGTSCDSSRAQNTKAGCQRLPPGTVLDGEMVWLGDKGFFLAFDALMLGHERVWDKTLDERLHVFEELRLQEAGECRELRQAYEQYVFKESNYAEVSAALVFALSLSLSLK